MKDTIRMRRPHARRPDRKGFKDWETHPIWSATCSCGWLGPWRDVQSLTVDDYRTHRDQPTV